MSAIRRFMQIDDENPTFRFTIDTTKINPSGTDGSENPLTFRIPCASLASVNSAIIKVSDGRPDIIVTPSTPSSVFTLTFDTAGVYEITIIGRLSNFSFYSSAVNYDRRKFVEITHFGGFKLGIRTFINCENLVINSDDGYVLNADSQGAFSGIKEIITDLNKFDTSQVTSASVMLSNIQTPLTSLFNPFWKSLVTYGVYNGVTLDSSINKIQIISESITTLSQPFNAITTTATLELDIQTPNLTTMFRVFYNGAVKSRSHGGKIDVRNVTNTDGWLNGTFTNAQVDATLLGWANNLPYMQSGVTWNWNGSKYSNNPAVIAAYNKITSDWGVIFTNLTMA